MWIAIIVSIALACGGIAFGAIQASSLAHMRRNYDQVKKHEVIIQKLSTQQAVIENELKHINTKLDKLLHG